MASQESKGDLFSSLPDHVILRIFKLVPILHLTRCVSAVNKRFREISQDSSLAKVVHLRPEIECLTPLREVPGVLFIRRVFTFMLLFYFIQIRKLLLLTFD